MGYKGKLHKFGFAGTKDKYANYSVSSTKLKDMTRRIDELSKDCEALHCKIIKRGGINGEVKKR